MAGAQPIVVQLFHVKHFFEALKGCTLEPHHVDSVQVARTLCHVKRWTPRGRWAGVLVNVADHRLIPILPLRGLWKDSTRQHANQNPDPEWRILRHPTPTSITRDYPREKVPVSRETSRPRKMRPESRLGVRSTDHTELRLTLNQGHPPPTCLHAKRGATANGKSDAPGKAEA